MRAWSESRIIRHRRSGFRWTSSQDERQGKQDSCCFHVVLPTSPAGTISHKKRSANFTTRHSVSATALRPLPAGRVTGIVQA